MYRPAWFDNAISSAVFGSSATIEDKNKLSPPPVSGWSASTGCHCRHQINRVGIGVIDDGIPNRAAAAIFHHSPPFQVFAASSISGCSNGLLGSPGTLEAPVFFAGFGVIGGHIAAHAIFAATIADKHAAIGNARRAGNGVSAGAINNRVTRQISSPVSALRKSNSRPDWRHKPRRHRPRHRD